MPKRKELSVEDLADELFGAVEYDQGRGFVSDGMGALKSRPEFFEVARLHLRHTELAAKKLRAFLRKYGETAPRKRDTK